MASAFKLAPTPQWTLRYIQALLANGQTDKAFTTAESWLKEHPQSHGFRRQLADYYLNHGNYGRASRHYVRLADEEVADSETLNNLAWALHQTDDAQALEYAERAVASADNNINAIDTLAWILIDTGRDPRRGTELLRAVNDIPDALYPTMQYHLAVGLEKLGERRAAVNILSGIVNNNHRFTD
ncbi:MAG: tetratricopeptide repeat protein, partial [Gammaproteobacteria bacterium]